MRERDTFCFVHNFHQFEDLVQRLFGPLVVDLGEGEQFELVVDLGFCVFDLNEDLGGVWEG